MPEGRAWELALSPRGSFPHPRVPCPCSCSASSQMWHGWEQEPAFPLSNGSDSSSKADPGFCQWIPLLCAFPHRTQKTQMLGCRFAGPSTDKHARPPEIRTPPPDSSRAGGNPACRHRWTQALTEQSHERNAGNAATHPPVRTLRFPPPRRGAHLTRTAGGCR